MNRGLRCSHTIDPFANKDIDLIVNREMILILCKLNKSGLNMLEYLNKNGYVYKGMLLIDIKDFLTAMKLRSKKSFYLGIDDLVKWGILAKADQVSFYYFNKKYFPSYGSDS